MMDTGETSAELFAGAQNGTVARPVPMWGAATWKVNDPASATNQPRLPILFEHLQGALWTTDADLRLTSWQGPGVADITPQPDEAVGARLLDVFGSSNAALTLDCAHREALQGAPTTLALDLSGRIYEVHVAPLRHGGGRIVGTVGLAQDVTEHMLAHQELRQAGTELDSELEARSAELRSLYEQAQKAAVLQERQRLARDLHDAVTQMLFSASLIAEVLPRIWERDQDKARGHLQDLRMLTRGALAEMRSLLLELRPAALTNARLGDLLQQVAESLMGRIGVPVTLTVRDARGRRAPALPPDVRTTLYRVAQEALNNIAKHAQASQVTIYLDLQPAEVDLTIRDNGKGFDLQSVTADHLGLDIMRERVAAIGGTLIIESHPGHGTLIHVRRQG